VTRRDRYIVVVIGLVGLLGAYWLLALAPKRDKLGKLDKDVAAAKQTLQVSEQEKTRFAQAQVQFPTLYASLGRLGKAVPGSEDVPSFIVQLNHAARLSRVNFRSVEFKLDQQEKLAVAAPPAAPAAPAGSAPAGATGAQGATGAAGATAGAPAATGTAPAAPAATLQPLPFEYLFKGDYFRLEDLIHNVSDLVSARNHQVSVSGRLVVIQGFAMKRGKVTILATTYMLPADQALFGGATPSGPAGATAATPQPASAPTGAAPTAPPSATVTP
jgi:hypothetical protein